MARLAFLEAHIRTVHYAFGIRIAKWPSVAIALPILLSLGLCGGLYYTRVRTDVDNLYRTKTSLPEEDARFEEQSAENRYLRVICTSRDDSIDGVWSTTAMEEIFRLDALIRNQGVGPGGQLIFKHVCLKRGNGCIPNSLFSLSNYNASLFDSLNLTYPIHRQILSPPREPENIFLAEHLGGVSVNDEGRVVQVKSVLLIYQTNSHDERAFCWEDEMGKLVKSQFSEGRTNFDHISVSVVMTESVGMELVTVTLESLPVLAVCVLVVCVFAIVLSLSTDWVIAKPWLLFGGVVVNILAVAAGTGLLLFFTPYTNMSIVVAFFVMGVGVQDNFILLASWRKFSMRYNVGERLADTLAEAATPMAVSTISYCLVLALMATSVAADVVWSLGVYTCIVLLTCRVLCLMVYSGCMVYSGQGEATNKHAITGHTAMPSTQAGDRSCCFRFWCTGGSSVYLSPMSSEVTDLRIMRFFRDTYSRALTATVTRAVVLILYVGYLAVFIWCCLSLKKGTMVQDFFRDGTDVHRDFELRHEHHRSYMTSSHVVVNGDVKYWLKESRDALDAAIADLERVGHYHGRGVNEVWTRDFEAYTKARNVTTPNKERFMIILDKVFLEEPAFSHYRHDIKMTEDKTDIVISRFKLFQRGTETEYKNVWIKNALNLHSKPGNSKVNLTTIDGFSELFIDTDNSILVCAVQNLGIVLAALLVLCAFFIPNPAHAIHCVVGVISMMTGIVGFTSLIGLPLSISNLFTLALANILAITYAVHIVYVYATSYGETRGMRVKETLYHIGFMVIQGSVIVALAVAPLLFSEVQMFRDSAKIILIATFICSLHGVVILPVILSIIGPTKGTKSCKCESRDYIEYKVTTMRDTTSTMQTGIQMPITSRPNMFSPSPWADTMASTSSEQSSQESIYHGHNIDNRIRAGLGYNMRFGVNPKFQSCLWTPDRYSHKRTRHSIAMANAEMDKRAQNKKKKTETRDKRKGRFQQSANVEATGLYSVNMRSAYRHRSAFWVGPHNHVYSMNGDSGEEETRSEWAGSVRSSCGGGDVDEGDGSMERRWHWAQAHQAFPLDVTDIDIHL